MASHKLSENVLPPVSPLAATTMNTANSRINAIAKPTDHFPKAVVGIPITPYVWSETLRESSPRKRPWSSNLFRAIIIPGSMV